MEVLRIGLILGALAFLYVSWASWDAGYPPEVAALRGGVAFMAVTIVGYLGELVVASAPPRGRAAAGGDAGQDGGAGAAPARVPAAPPVPETPVVPAPIEGVAAPARAGGEQPAAPQLGAGPPPVGQPIVGVPANVGEPAELEQAA